MSSDNPKRALYSHFAAVARLLASEHRLELLELLAQGEHPVERLVQRTGLPFANVSQHLQQLRKGGLVAGRRDGKNIIYSLQDGPITEAVVALRNLAAHNIGAVQEIIDAYFTDPDELEPITTAELRMRMESDSVTVLDVRPADEFSAGHLPGAINIEPGELEARLSELPTTREIVAYCRGPYCILSQEAVAALRARGYVVRRMAQGFPEWKAVGYPIKAG
ncbi:ArsR/SmtB family transcription factor [Devosia sp. RR2S18]|uniref:ArsR/SmtB family transcription factor n=1 Tax=Devosia rhizosphaerae TaxID=3049774 RepID=UPI0025400381|nr:metalloregulator ArsR/SmtB family transcription factor [Devosia sp. RR2S18]WIJ26926.1 metalloregulator ArsR/SmtB family transcription factor [Devosia sp. RR2S18]